MTDHRESWERAWKGVGATLLPLLLAMLFSVPTCATDPTQDRSEIRTAYEQAVHDFDQLDDPWLADRAARAKEAGAVQRTWQLQEAWAITYLHQHPESSADELATAIRELPLSYASVVELEQGKHKGFVVAGGLANTGNLFIITVDNGVPRVVWRLADAARRLAPRWGEFRQWSYFDADFVDACSKSQTCSLAPLLAELQPLPSSRAGKPRVLVKATRQVPAGVTWSRQLSVWEWDSGRMEPLFVKDYEVLIDDNADNVTVDGSTIRIGTEEPTRYLEAECSACVWNRATWTVQVTPDGVQDLGTELAQPHLAAIDELFLRIRTHADAAAIANAPTIHRLRQFFASHCRDAAAESRPVVSGFHVTGPQAKQTWRLSLDGCPREIVATVQLRGRHAYVTDASARDR